eukprot:6178259-Pleurochrysis_carterae.AAC.2
MLNETSLSLKEACSPQQDQARKRTVQTGAFAPFMVEDALDTAVLGPEERQRRRHAVEHLADRPGKKAVSCAK